MEIGSRHLGKIAGQHSLPQFHLSLLGSASYKRGGTWRRKWERLEIVGGQGWHNKPIGCGASGAYAPGRDDEEEEYRHIGTTHRSHLEGSSSPRKILRLLDGTVWNYHRMLRKVPEEHRSHVLCKLQSGNIHISSAGFVYIF
jgi:hypothetical protein